MKIFMATMGLDIGGAETHIVELAKELKKRGNDVIVASNGGVYVPEIEAVGIRHYTVPLNRRSPVPMLRSLVTLNKLLRSERPDVVHAHARIPGFLCGLIHKTYKFPFVTTAHWVFDTGGLLGRLTNWGEKTIAVSDDIRDYLIKNYGIRQENIFVTINGIDTEKFSPDISGREVREKAGIPQNALVISHVSRIDFSREMAARQLINIAERLDREIPGVVILIAGGGDAFDELSAKADAVNVKLGRKCIIMTGPRTDINKIIAAGNVFVGVSRAALEAMSVAKPVVIAGNEGYMGVFTEEKLSVGIEGNFCCRGCAEMTEDTLLKDVTGLFKCTDSERDKLGTFGRDTVIKYYSVERMADDAEKAYNAAIGPRKFVMSGYYGYGNAGDEAILQSVHDSIIKNMPDAQVTVLSRTPETTRMSLRCEAVDRFNLFAVKRAIKKCDVLVSGGGSLLQDSTSTRSLIYYLGIINTAKRRGKKVMLFANGIGPVKKDKNRRRVKKAAEIADAVTLRDPDSIRELKDMGVAREDLALTADPVFLLEPAEEKVADVILKAAGVPEGDFIVVSVRRWFEAADFEDKFADICDRVFETYGKNIVFASMQLGSDDEYSKSIIGKMRSNAYLVPGGYTAQQLMAVMKKANLVLSMRLHSMIFAANVAVPAVGFVYDPKVVAYLDMLQMPSAGDVRDIDVNRAVGVINAVIENREAYVEKLEIKRKELKKAARDNEKYLMDILR